MKRVVAALLCALSLTVSCFARTATAQTLERSVDTSIVWVAQPVRGPLPLAAIRAEAPFVPEGTPELAGKVQVSAERVISFWLDANDIVRVSTISGAAPQFQRVLGNSGSHGLLSERGISVRSGETYLRQPSGHGDVWTIGANGMATIVVERPIVRRGRQVWEQLESALLRWVDEGAALPELPLTTESGELALQLEAERAAGEVLVTTFPNERLGPAVASWRRASLLAALSAARPLVRPVFSLEPLEEALGLGAPIELETSDGEPSMPYHRAQGTGIYRLWVEGPGVLYVQARSLLPTPPASSEATFRVAVRSAGRLLADRIQLAHGAMRSDGREPPAAFPTRLPLRSRAGELLSEQVDLALPLAPGRHLYEIEARGGSLALRVTAARRRPRLGEVLAATPTIERELDAAQRALGKGPGSALLSRWLEQLSGSAASSHAVMIPSAPLPALLDLSMDITPPRNGRDAARLVAQARAHFAQSSALRRELKWWLFSRIARRVSDDPAALRTLYASTPDGVPPAELMPTLSEHLPTLGAVECVRSTLIAQMDDALRVSPLDPRLRSAARSTWRQTNWAIVAPDEASIAAAPVRPSSWLEPVNAAEQPSSRFEPGNWWRLEAGGEQAILAPVSSVDASKAALLNLYVWTPEQTPGPIQVTIGQRSFASLGVSAFEHLQFAVPPGRQNLALVAPSGSFAWVSLPPLGDAPLPLARQRRGWSLPEAGRALRFELPSPSARGPVEIRLRALAQGNQEPIRVKVQPERGEEQLLTIWPGAPDRSQAPLDGAPRSSRELSFVVNLATPVRAVRVSADGTMPLAVTVAVRRGHVTPVASGVGPRAAPLTAVAVESRHLAKVPGDSASRMRRAGALIDLGELDLAERDLGRVARLPVASFDADSQAIFDALVSRLEEAKEPTHVARPVVKAAVPIAPALLALESGEEQLARLLPVVRAGRRSGQAAALAELGNARDVVSVQLRSRYAMEGQAAAALDILAAYLESGRWQLGLQALSHLEPYLTQPNAASLAFGLASQLDAEVEHPDVKRVLLDAASRSRWEPVSLPDASDGTEFLHVSAQPESALAAVRGALVPTPWIGKEAQLVTPGNAAVLSLTLQRASEVTAHVVCTELRSPGDGSSPCALRARVDEGPEHAFAAALDQPVPLTFAELAPGAHVLRVSLVGERATSVASVRFSRRSNDVEEAIPVTRRIRLQRASVAQPVEVTVAGPASLRVESRAVSPGPGRRVLVLAATEDGRSWQRSASLSEEVDRSAYGEGERAVSASSETETLLLLPETRPYRVSVKPTQGEALVRLFVRRGRTLAVDDHAVDPWWRDASSLRGAVPSREAAPDVTEISGAPCADCTSSRIGTLSMGVLVGQDDAPDWERDTAVTRSRVGAVVAYRRALPLDVYVRFSGLASRRESTKPVFGGAFGFTAAELPYGFALRGDLRAYTQRFAEKQAATLAGSAGVSHRLDLTTTLALGSRIDARWWRSSLSPFDVATTNEAIDPDLYLNYRYDHPFALTPRLAATWTPLQDLAATGAVRATTNADGRSFDQVGALFGARGLLPVLPALGSSLLVVLEYLPTYRLEDNHRSRAYVRHDLAVAVEAGVWTGRTGRLVVDLTGRAYLSADVPDRMMLSAALRYDFTFGRGLMDFAPEEIDFASIVEPQPWAPLRSPQR